MNRKWTVLAVTMAGAALTFTLMARSVAAADDESPLQQLMEKVNKTNNSVRNAVKTPVAYKKAGSKQILEDAEALLKYSKETRDFTEPAKNQKKSQKEWTDLTDAMIKATEDFIAVVKADKSQADAKKAFVPVTKSCSDCHAVFRVDEDF